MMSFRFHKHIFGLIFLLALLISGKTPWAQGHISQAMEEVFAKSEAVADPDRQVGNFDPDSMPSLPIGIVKNVGDSEVIIAIDSANFLPDGAYFSAYMALEFPGADMPLAFAAKGIQFNPKGILGGSQSKLMLVSQHIIELGPNTRLLLPDDGSNYVNWSCNGFESVNLHGYFLFSEGILSPPDNSADSIVTAEFEINIVDINNLMVLADFSPFVVQGMEDFTFEVSQAIVDMSDYKNPPGVQLPACYQTAYSEDINLWRGFYLNSFMVTLPEELNKSENRVQVYVNELFIDDAGVTGNFGATNLFSSEENAMNDEWGFSLELLAVDLTMNSITEGRMKGDITIPPLDNTTFDYDALITKNSQSRRADMFFSVNPNEDVSLSCFNSTLTLFPSTKLEVNRISKKFKPKLILNGTWELNNSNWKFSGLGFEKFTIISDAPYVTEGYFELISNGSSTSNAANFPVSISEIGLGVLGGQLAFGAEVGLNFGDPDQPTFSASTGVRIFSTIAKNPTSQKTEWKYDRFQLNTISLQVNTSAFEMKGAINFNEDHPVYGKGFYGGVTFQIPDIMDAPMSMACAFGRVDNYRYWMVDASMPTSIPVGAVTLTSIQGGMSYHMVNTKSQQDLISGVSSTTSSGSTLATNYVPNANSGLYFKAGVGFKNSLKEETLNGDVMFSISFNSSGGLSNINLSGDAYMMCKVSERKTSSNYAKGSVNINYDNQQKILNANLSMLANFSGALTANIWSQLYFSPNLWYVHLGRPSAPCTVNLLNLCSANAYFMLGQNLEPMPNPPPQVASVFNTMNDQRNETAITTGNGIACGMNLSASFDKTLPITEKIYVYGSGSAGAGFDMTLYKYSSNTHCEGSSAPFGANYWYLQGQLYAYAGILAGVAKKEGWDYTILEGNVAVLLQGKMPKPSYIYGGIYLQASILGVIDVDVTLDFDFGTNCVIVQ